MIEYLYFLEADQILSWRKNSPLTTVYGSLGALVYLNLLLSKLFSASFVFRIPGISCISFAPYAWRDLSASM